MNVEAVPGRSRAERRRETTQRLNAEANVWVSTAGPDGTPHLVPLSLAWDGTRLLVATPTNTPTVRNAAATGRARAALESTSDVVVIDAEAEVVPLSDADADTVATYVQGVGWDPRREGGQWSLVVLTPRRIQAWNGPSEIDGRTIMRDDVWLD